MGTGPRAALLAAVALAAACGSPRGAPAPAPPVPAAAPAPPEPAALATLFGPALDEALAAVGLRREDARCTPFDLDLASVGAFRLPLYEALQARPLEADRLSRVFREGALRAAPSCDDLAMFGFARTGVTVRRSLLGDPLAKEVEEASKPGALEAALGECGDPEPPPADAVPAPVRTAAALVLRAAARANRRLAALFAPHADRGFDGLQGGLPLRGLAGHRATLLLAGVEGEEEDALRHAFEEVTGSLDPRELAAAASDVLAAVDRAASILREASVGPFEYRTYTLEGAVLLRGAGSDDADTAQDAEREWLLRVDMGGNDRYSGGGGRVGSPRGRVSVLLDAGGDDAYEAPPDAVAFGGAVGGVGIAVDLRGDDRWILRGPRSLGLGAAAFGVGVLRDDAGDDAYEGEDFCMGAATNGVGALADLGGRDAYTATSYCQGFGFVRGAGLLVDANGNDRYLARDEPLTHPSAQSKVHNSSLAQGFGFGVRADYTDGRSLAGGVGLLVDGAGDDAYACGVFGQGGGYWMGVGMLLDGAGDDAYTGAWYVQGATAHFAVGILEDAAGNDAYEATLNMAQGAGHDYAVGVLIDRAGNDAYRAPNLSLGGGNANGIGLFVDGGGDDRYEAKGVTLGLARVATPADAPSLRHGSLTLGVFLDLGGRDAYGPGLGFAGDGRTWTQRERDGGDPRSNERGVGLDRP